MNSLSIQYKIFRLFLPLTLLAVSVTVGYSLLNWLLATGTGLIQLDEQLVGVWLPLVLSGVLVHLVVAPPLRALKLSEKRNVPFLFQIVAVAAVAAPTLIAQDYLKSASATISHVHSAAMVASVPRTNYYTADKVCVDRRNA